MPFITTRTNREITKEKEAAIAQKLGEAIGILGKSESWLMLDFQDNCRMYFRGKNTDSYAISEIKFYGKGTKQALEKMTAAVTKVLSEELAIPGEGIYVTYEEVENWGYNGSNL